MDGCLTLLSSLTTFLEATWDSDVELLHTGAGEMQGCRECSSMVSPQDLSSRWLQAVESLVEMHRALGSSIKSRPLTILPEDRMLFGFPPLASLHKDLFGANVTTESLEAQSQTPVDPQGHLERELGTWSRVRLARIGSFLAYLHTNKVYDLGVGKREKDGWSVR